MRLFLLLIAGSILAAGQNTSITPSGTLSQGERDRAMSYLHATQKQVTDTIATLTPAQLDFHAGPNRWSVGDCLEHLALTETGLFGMLKGQVMAAPIDSAGAPEKVALTAGKDDAVIKAISSREVKVKAPEMFVPSHKWKTTAETLAAFRAARKVTIAYVEKTPAELRLHFTEMPGMLMDGYQVILMIGAHTERHLAQMKEAMADPAFPKK